MIDVPDSDIQITPESVGNRPAAMLYFYNDACAPCVALKPRIFSMVKDAFPKIEQFYYNAAVHPELCAKYNVFSSPVFIFFFEGKEFYRGSNYVSLDELQQRIGRLYNLMFS